MDRRGQKTKAGYYDYDENRNAKPSPVTEKIIGDFMQKRGINARKISDEEILERCLYPMINEGVQILAEKKAIRASDIDVIWRYGYGFPVLNDRATGISKSRVTLTVNLSKDLWGF